MTQKEKIMLLDHSLAFSVLTTHFLNLEKELNKESINVEQIESALQNMHWSRNIMVDYFNYHKKIIDELYAEYDNL